VKALKRALRVLILTVAAYLLQVCVMQYLQIGGVAGSVLFAVLAVIVVSCGKKYAFCASCLIGMMMESMLSNVPGFYVIAYPVITMLCAQAFADMSDRQLERRRMLNENRRSRQREGGGRERWWNYLLSHQREGDLPAHLRIPLCAALMDFILNAALCVYMYLIGEELGMIHVARVTGSVLYTVGIALLLMVPLRYILRMYTPRKREKGGEAL